MIFPITVVKRLTTAIFLAVLLLGAAGCGGIKSGKVSGTVTFQGKPMPGGYINFYSVASDGRLLTQRSGPIGDDGAYSVDKVPVGDVKITVQPPPGTLNTEMTDKKGSLPKRGPPPVTLPEQYQDIERTDLKYKVTPGDQKYDVVMK